ncbi:hypothetical protein DM02DRAFT_342003 [Periconia macrospinosa]|uniref:Uncharacterized protein n=1 Tax=Periconia macrospinosa TaxID=97972 RepID=A0A2V1D2G1_9PLEO|nr:hypothetical protein DM02DRAFT_342003 [Periconia macrospinosa]
MQYVPDGGVVIHGGLTSLLTHPNKLPQLLMQVHLNRKYPLNLSAPPLIPANKIDVLLSHTVLASKPSSCSLSLCVSLFSPTTCINRLSHQQPLPQSPPLPPKKSTQRIPNHMAPAQCKCKTRVQVRKVHLPSFLPSLLPPSYNYPILSKIYDHDVM